MKILDNEFVLKYFGCSHKIQSGPEHDSPRCKHETAGRVLQAMQEPIKKGELWLFVNEFGLVELHNRDEVDGGTRNYHPHALRLPSRFQAQEKKKDPCKGKTCFWDCPCSCHTRNQEAWDKASGKAAGR